MLKSFAVAAVALVGLPTFATAQWSDLVTESEITTATSLADADLREFATNGSNLYVASDNDTSDKVLLLDPTLTVNNQARLLVSDADVMAAINAANGTAADYVAGNFSVQGLGFNSTGKVICYTDNSGGVAASLLLIDPSTNPAGISVLSTAVDGNPSPVEGGNAMTMNGDIAYLLVESAFGASEDAVLSVDTSVVVNDGSATVNTVIGSADLNTAAGAATSADYRHNSATMLSPTELLVTNSGLDAGNQNIIKVTLSPTVSAETYINGSEILAELQAIDGTTDDLGFEAIAVDAGGNIHLADMFGDAGIDNVIISISAVNSPSDVTLSIESLDDIGTDVGGSNAFLSTDGLVYDASLDRLVIASNGVGAEGLFQSPVLFASVSDWNLMD